MNRSKRIEFWPPPGGQPLPRPGGKGGARRNPEAGFDPGMGRNLCRHNLTGSGLVVPFLVLKGAPACFSRKPEEPSAGNFARRGFLRAPPLSPGHDTRGEHKNPWKRQTLFVPRQSREFT